MSENKKNPNAEELLNGTPKYPDRAKEPSVNYPQAQGVYAGPEMPVAMTTYAGPNMMNNNFGFMFQNIGSVPQQEAQKKPEQNADLNGKVCGICGHINPEKAKFCGECGHIFGGKQG